eukprot:TRINITY_DN2686_c0_g1_i1.p1 TRINITY_DN2686_c0_g1~~TRINITY_DN2686_c0_g1_i1.p1  ORF type:complete len:159 (-),score=50.22 TRINITY_DN2686_c0_g1_i1:6-482(-)
MSEEVTVEVVEVKDCKSDWVVISINGTEWKVTPKDKKTQKYGQKKDFKSSGGKAEMDVSIYKESMMGKKCLGKKTFKITANDFSTESELSISCPAKKEKPPTPSVRVKIYYYVPRAGSSTIGGMAAATPTPTRTSSSSALSEDKSDKSKNDKKSKKED